MKEKLKLLLAAADRERLAPVVEALRAQGLRAEETEAPRQGEVVLAALSENFYADSGCTEKLLGLLGAGAQNVLPLQLDAAPIPDKIKNAIYARNIIPADGRDAEQIAERIAAALPKKKSRLPLILSAAALVLIAAAGLLLWQRQTPPPPQETPAPVAEETPEPTPSLPIPEGITEEDLAKIRVVNITGEVLHCYTDEELKEMGNIPDWDYLAVRDYQQDGPHWYSREDGHEMALTRYEDLRFLALMPNLQFLFFNRMEAGLLPDLSGASKLEYVVLGDSVIPDLNWLSGSGARVIHILNSTGSIRDFSPLTACKKLTDVHIDLVGCREAELGGFAPPKLSWFWLNNCSELNAVDLSGLLACTELREMQIDGGNPAADLSFLKNAAKLQRLRLEDLDRLRDISAIGDKTQLRDLTINYCGRLVDFTPIAGCTALQSLEIHTDWSDVRLQDASFLADLPDLRNIELLGVALNDMEFLANYGGRNIELSFAGDIRDYSGLAYVKDYAYLHVNPRNNNDRGRGGDFSAVLPYIQDATIGRLMLFSCAGIDLSALPEVKEELSIRYGDLSDLSGLQAWSLERLELWDCGYLRSLDGLEALPTLSAANPRLEIGIYGCPRLTDFSALDGCRLEKLRLVGTYALPDFGAITAKTLRLESTAELEDLSCLDALNADGKLDFELVGLEDVHDLSPLRRFQGNTLTVPPHLMEQAQELVEDGNFKRAEVAYPDGSWRPDEGEITLLSLDELETLPRAVLKRVTRVSIAGDALLDTDRYDVDFRWEDDGPIPVLRDRESGEETPMAPGTIEDLSLFETLTGLRDLRLYNQPLGSLEGVQKFESLECFSACFCPALTDASPLFSLQGLREIELRGTGVDSIQGIQNLAQLRRLNVSDTAVTDFTPLADCDLSAVYEQGGGFDLDANDLEISAESFAAIGSIRRFNGLAFVNADPAVWLPALAESEIRYFGAAGDLRSNEDLAALCAGHPELRSIWIGHVDGITDLTPLLALEELEEVSVSGQMKEALASLEGQACGFRLNVTG